jgi:hypothetical protein
MFERISKNRFELARERIEEALFVLDNRYSTIEEREKARITLRIYSKYWIVKEGCIEV